jgi:hypothetical protein
MQRLTKLTVNGNMSTLLSERGGEITIRGEGRKPEAGLENTCLTRSKGWIKKQSDGERLLLDAAQIIHREVIKKTE